MKEWYKTNKNMKKYNEMFREEVPCDCNCRYCDYIETIEESFDFEKWDWQIKMIDGDCFWTSPIKFGVFNAQKDGYPEDFPSWLIYWMMKERLP